MAVLLGGRASEVLIFNELSTGAADDFAKATDIARNMVMRFGMDKKLGLVAYEQPHASFLPGVAEDHSGMRRYSETTAREIDNAVHDILEVAFNRALDILKQRRELLAKCALKLLEHETLSREELLALVGNDSSATAPSTNIRAIKDNQ